LIYWYFYSTFKTQVNTDFLGQSPLHRFRWRLFRQQRLQRDDYSPRRRGAIELGDSFHVRHARRTCSAAFTCCAPVLAQGILDLKFTKTTLQFSSLARAQELTTNKPSKRLALPAMSILIGFRRSTSTKSHQRPAHHHETVTAAPKRQTSKLFN
jgi:hypothetical protein